MVAPVPRLEDLMQIYKYQGEETCAADGMCQVKCPVKINTGELIKSIRAEELGTATRASKIANVCTSPSHHVPLRISFPAGGGRLHPPLPGGNGGRHGDRHGKGCCGLSGVWAEAMCAHVLCMTAPLRQTWRVTLCDSDM